MKTPHRPRRSALRRREPRRSAVLRSAVVLVLLLCAIGCAESDAPARDNIDLASQAPQIPVPDARDFDLGAHKGKIVIVNFWATWCQPCRIETPALVELRKQFSPDEVIIVGISTNELGAADQILGKLARFVDSNQINYPVYFDESQDVTRRFYEMAPFNGIPATFVIDQQGQIYKRHLGIPQRNGKIDPLGILQDDVQELLSAS